jgi:hypothetical protein
VILITGCNDLLGIRAPQDLASGTGGSHTGGTTGHGGTTATGGTTGTGGSHTGGTTGTGGTPAPTEVVLVTNAKGFVDGTNAAGVEGAWYTYSDGDKDCPTAGHTSCSSFTKPASGSTFTPDSSGRMCVSGTAAEVTGSDYTNIWGAAVALDLDRPSYDGGVAEPYNATTHGYSGLAFDIDSVPVDGFGTSALRVEISTPSSGNDSPYWDGATMNTSPVVRGTNMISWSQVNGPMYLKTTPPTFTPSAMLSLHFHVVSNGAAPITFSFCISNLAMLK